LKQIQNGVVADPIVMEKARRISNGLGSKFKTLERKRTMGGPIIAIVSLTATAARKPKTSETPTSAARTLLNLDTTRSERASRSPELSATPTMLNIPTRNNMTSTLIASPSLSIGVKPVATVRNDVKAIKAHTGM